VGPSPATLSRVRDARGSVWTELTWVTQSRRILIRVAPEMSDIELMRLARSLHRGRP
jgi:hypothetical protein